MSIPKHIEKSILNSAKHFKIANDEKEKVREWLFNNGYDAALNDMLIDSCELCQSPEGFIEFLNGAVDENGYTIDDFKGNDNVEDLSDFN